MNETKVEYANQISAKISTATGGWYDLGQDALGAFFARFWDLNAAVPIDTMKIAVSGDVMAYTITLKDGRTWHQDLRFDVMDDPGQTFDVGDYWRLSEFLHGRALREEVVRLHGKYTIQELKVTMLTEA